MAVLLKAGSRNLQESVIIIVTLKKLTTLHEKNVSSGCLKMYAAQSDT